MRVEVIGKEEDKFLHFRSESDKVPIRNATTTPAEGVVIFKDEERNR
jgi:hypothetical protein